MASGCAVVLSADAGSVKARAAVAALPVPGRAIAGVAVLPGAGAAVASGAADVTRHGEELYVCVLGEVANLAWLAKRAGAAPGANASAVLAKLYVNERAREWLPLVRGRFAVVILDGSDGRALAARGTNGSPLLRYGRNDDGAAVVLAGAGIAVLSEEAQNGVGRALQPFRFLYGNTHFDVVRKYSLSDEVEESMVSDSRAAAGAALAPPTPTRPVSAGAYVPPSKRAAIARAAAAAAAKAEEPAPAPAPVYPSEAVLDDADSWRSTKPLPASVSRDPRPVSSAFSRYVPRTAARPAEQWRPVRRSHAVSIVAPPPEPEAQMPVARDEPAAVEVAALEPKAAAPAPADEFVALSSSALLRPAAPAPLALPPPSPRAVSPRTARRFSDAVSALYNKFVRHRGRAALIAEPVSKGVEAPARSCAWLNDAATPRSQRHSLDVARVSLDLTRLDSTSSLWGTVA